MRLRNYRITTFQVIALGFLSLILIGTLLLMLPVSSRNPGCAPFADCLFTAASAVCVTGLVVVDTATYWTAFGQAVILLLIQIGGMGVVTAAVSLAFISGRKIGLLQRSLLQESISAPQVGGIVRLTRFIVITALSIELAGALLLLPSFIPAFGWIRGIWYALFHSVSAFCNAGMDVIGPNSLGDYRDNPLVMTVTILLIVFGGLGFVVWFDVMDQVKEGAKRRFDPITVIKRFSEHTKLVLSFTLFLLISGMMAFLVLEFNNPGTIGGMGFGGKLANSFFESVTLRTAGFTTFPQENLRLESCIVAYLFMFIGGSPIGTAGGIKTTTFFLLIMNVRSYLRNQDDKVIFNHRVSEDSMRKASAVVFVSATAVFMLTILLLIVNPVSMEDAFYEVVSACGTVGLSRGLTSSLGSLGRFTIIIAMYLGRIGPISLVALFSRNSVDANKLKYAEGTFYVG